MCTFCAVMGNCRLLVDKCLTGKINRSLMSYRGLRHERQWVKHPLQFLGANPDRPQPPGWGQHPEGSLEDTTHCLDCRKCTVLCKGEELEGQSLSPLQICTSLKCHYLFWKSCFQLDPRVQCWSKSWNPIHLEGNMSTYTPGYIKTLCTDVIKYRTLSDKQNVLFYLVRNHFSWLAVQRGQLCSFFKAYIWSKDKVNKAHRVREPVAFQDRKSGRSKKWAALFQQLSFRF